MNEPLDDLTEVLLAQAAELRMLAPLLDEQQAALARADSARVAAAMFRQDPVLRRLLRLDERRQRLIDTLAARLGTDGGPLTLSALLARVPTAPAALRAVHAELGRLLEAIDVRNRRNAFLLERAASCIEGLLRAMTAPAAEPVPVYAATGRSADVRSGPRLVDRSA